MSNYSQFGGGGIKSIQRGVITISTASNSGTATITSVNTAKTELRLLGQNGIDTGTGVQLHQPARIQLTNSTTVTANLLNNSNGSTSVSWELTEWS